MNLPTRDEINVFDSLDEQTACEHFLGKTLDDAESLLRENAHYVEDLMWMGPAAFRFYVRAAMRYMQSDAATGRCEMILALAAALQFRLAHEPHELTPIARELASLCRYVVEHWQRFGMDAGFDDERRAQYVRLERRLLSLERDPEAGQP